MNCTLSKVLFFVGGAALGSIVTWKVLEARLAAKYERLVKEDVENVKAALEKRYRGGKEPIEAESEEDHDDTDMDDYEAVLSASGYVKYSDVASGAKNEGVTDMRKKPYVIAPDDFDTLDDYDADTLTYYADGILTDEWDNPIEDVEGTVGKDSLLHFGEYEDDCVHVRNEERKTDYEILRDCRKFSDVINNNPHLVEAK